MENGLEESKEKMKDQRRCHWSFLSWWLGLGWLQWEEGDQHLDIYVGEEPQQSSLMDSMWPWGKETGKAPLLGFWLHKWVGGDTIFFLQWCHFFSVEQKEQNRFGEEIRSWVWQSLVFTHIQPHTYTLGTRLWCEADFSKWWGFASQLKQLKWNIRHHS